MWRTFPSAAAFDYLALWATNATGTSGDVADGLALAERLCAACHAVKHDVPGPRIAGVPSFPIIANRPDQTADRLSGRIMAPHPPMPTIALTAVEIRDLAAYILSLKEAQ